MSKDWLMHFPCYPRISAKQKLALLAQMTISISFKFCVSSITDLKINSTCTNENTSNYVLMHTFEYVNFFHPQNNI